MKFHPYENKTEEGATNRAANFRDWSLITRRGATKQEGGGHVKFYPYEKGG